MFVGMDVGQTQTHSRQITVHAQRLSVVIDALRPLVMDSSHWSAEDAESFRQRFLGSAAQPAEDAHDAPLQFSRALVAHLAEQDATSDSQSGIPDSPTVLTPAEMDQIYHDDQVEDDEIVLWERSGVQRKMAEILGMEIPEPQRMTATEAEILDGMSPLEKKEFMEGTDLATNEAKVRYGAEDGSDPHIPTEGHPFNDDHADAFRHAYPNALSSRTLGEDRATDFWTAHERIPGNQGTREAMDLYNNEVGRRIAADNPRANDEELADLVQKSIDDGEMVVINAEGKLVPSNSVTPSETGAPPLDDPVMPGHPQTS